MKKSILRVATFIILANSILYISCKKKKTNEKLYEDSKSSELSFYKGKDTIYDAKGGSPHGNFKLKFNSTAVASLGSDGKLPVGGNFNEGSLIVKEVYSGNELTLYAIMKKDSKSKFASNKWVWAEYKPNGDVVYNVSKDGKSCTSCHSSGTTRDFTRSFDLH
ncbi:MAG: cytochrome P460 family protein [Bacteroidia bacterium]|nr:cytochrome P460 family protein [Bacteroidia bacterium]